MPLLKKKKPLEKVPLFDFLMDNELVYYCDITDEIFRDYDQFCDRVILCNSMIWSCAITGKTGLTYKEALESEENAKKSLKNFPTALRIPVLFLAAKTQRTALSDVIEDVFSYVKDRYFVGEAVEACISSTKWSQSYVLKVLGPNNAEIKSYQKNEDENSISNHIPSSLYRYELESIIYNKSNDEQISEIITANPSCIRRKKTLISKEKTKIFLKQHMDQNVNGFWHVKESSQVQYDINRIAFKKIFCGPEPEFLKTKKTIKNNSECSKKTKQDTLISFLSKNNIVQNGQKNNKENKNNNILEIMKQKEMEHKKIVEEMKQKKAEEMKQKKAEEKEAKRLRKKEEKMKLENLLKEWNKVKEDLELEDHKKLPTPIPIESKISDKYLGDVFNIIEFVHVFRKRLYVQDFFPCGLNLEIMEKALLEKEVAGPFIDLIQMLLIEIFDLQNNEAKQYSITVEKRVGNFKNFNCKDTISLSKAIEFATLSYNWSRRHLKLPIIQLPVASLTTSEILRLHLLSSGAAVNENGTKWRYMERGGYTSEQDPGLLLRRRYPYILKALAYNCVSKLCVGDKIKIINCLIEQIMTYADVRDIIEERLEKARQAKLDLKVWIATDKKRENEYLALAAKTILTSELDKLEKENERKKKEFEKSKKKLAKIRTENQFLLGYDRAFRRYYCFESIPAVFVEFDDEHAGRCLEHVITQNPAMINANSEQMKIELIKMNENGKIPHVNGFHNDNSQSSEELLLCSADPSTCIVHSTVVKRQRWSFFHTEEHLNALLDSLNKRGNREGELHFLLQSHKEILLELMALAPVSQLNKSIPFNEPVKTNVLKLRSQKKSKYEDANMGYPATMSTEEILEAVLIENILDMEEKIRVGSLGKLRVADKNEWRKNLEERQFDKMDQTIVKDEIQSEENGYVSPDITIKPFWDPGLYLDPTLDIESEDSDEGGEEVLLSPIEQVQKSVHGLAIALAQVARSLEIKYIKNPLGSASLKISDLKKQDPGLLLDYWEQSLLESTSYGQLFLHYAVLDASIMWSRSALLASCRICGKKSDGEKMLLCDHCNFGHHMYCLKPKLIKVPEGDWFCLKCTREKEKKQQEEEEKNKPKQRRQRHLEEEEEDTEEQDTEEEDEMEEEEEEELCDDTESEKQEEEEEEETSDEEFKIYKKVVKYPKNKEEEKNNVMDEEEDYKKVKVKVKVKTKENKQLEKRNGKLEEINCEMDTDSEPQNNDDKKYDRCLINGTSKECIPQCYVRLQRMDDGQSSLLDACKTCKSGGELLCCDSCPDMFHIECVKPPLRRVPRGEWFCERCKLKRKRNSNGDGRMVEVTRQRRCAEKARHMIHGFAKSLRRISHSDDSTSFESDHFSIDSDDDIPMGRRSNRREMDVREDLPLHNVALQELISEVLKMDDCWPFITPVKKNEVPDYYKVIAKPMDFGTIKYKLNMGEYKCDADLMSDVVLVFENCDTYNDSNSEVAKCGERLLRYFVARAKDFGLKLPSDLSKEEEDDNVFSRQPASKRVRLN